MILLLSSGRCSLLGRALPCLVSQLNRSKGELVLGGCHAIALFFAWRRRHPPSGPHGNLTVIGTKSQRKNDTGAGDGGCPRCSCQAHHLQKHFLISGAHLLPRHIHSWSKTSLRSLTVMHSQPVEHPRPENTTTATTLPRGWKLPPGPRQYLEHSLHSTSSPLREGPGLRAAVKAPHQYSSLSGYHP